MPKELYHWSKDPLDIFLNDEPRFKVNTQGRAWVIDKISKTKGATSRPTASSLVVFRNQAAKLFVKHPAWSFLGWKRIFGQYWSKDIYQDLVWDAADTFQCGRVLVVTKAKFSPIDEPDRHKKQIFKRRRILAIEILFNLFVIDTIAYFVVGWNVTSWLVAQLQPFDYRTGFLIMGVATAALAIIIHRMKIVRKPNLDGSVWNVEAELACAIEEADRAGSAVGHGGT